MLEGCESSPGPADAARPAESPPTDDAATAPAAPLPSADAPPWTFTAESVRLLALVPGGGADDVPPDEYERHLHAPMRALLSRIRAGYLQPLDPEVAAGRRQLTAFRKGGFGKGRRHDHLGFAFYDPAVSSKARSAQLYFRLDAGRQTFEYGFAVPPPADEYRRRLRKAAGDAPDAVCALFKAAPARAVVSREAKDHAREWPPADWCGLLRGGAGLAFGAGLQVTGFAVRVSLPLAELPARAASLADDVGTFLAWAWPFFQASRTGVWPVELADVEVAARRQADRAPEADDQAAESIDELAERTSLDAGLLRDMEEALLGQHQIVLTGPPGTSKTFVAGQLARYFAREREGRPQGVTHTLYMHAGWAYEDFFEGVRPVETGGRLAFENRPGVFLRWVREELWGLDGAARHVLILDELNRCDTAAVLGELLQLLEYRGVTVPLLSGRPFVFPENLYLVGTMNSADRSIGRLDLALRRRFFWIDLHPQPAVLARWLARPGNNPAGFDADALAACNDMLAARGIPPEQQIGHALFMGNGGQGGEGTPAADVPLTDRRLRQVVQFSVVPYVRELMAAHGTIVGDDLLGRIETTLLACAEQPAW